MDPPINIASNGIDIDFDLLGASDTGGSKLIAESKLGTPPLSVI